MLASDCGLLSALTETRVISTVMTSALSLSPLLAQQPMGRCNRTSSTRVRGGCTLSAAVEAPAEEAAEEAAAAAAAEEAAAAAAEEAAAAAASDWLEGRSCTPDG